MGSHRPASPRRLPCAPTARPWHLPSQRGDISRRDTRPSTGTATGPRTGRMIWMALLHLDRVSFGVVAGQQVQPDGSPVTDDDAGQPGERREVGGLAFVPAGQ